MSQQRLQPKPDALAARDARRASTPSTAAPDPDESELERFSRALHARYPNRLIKRFVMPSRVREAREVFIMELTSRDEINASIFAEQSMSAIEKASFRLAQDAEIREMVRASICGVGVLRGETVMYRHINHDGVPFADLDNWTPGAWAALRTYHGNVNGVPTDELRAGIEAAQTVGAYAPPQSSEAPNGHASTGK